MIVTWTLNIGHIWMRVPDEEVLTFVESLAKIGISCEVTQE